MKSNKYLPDQTIQNDAVPPRAATHWRIPVWFPNLSEHQNALFKIFFDHLLLVNKHASVVTNKSLANADAIHFADSILASDLVSKNINKNEVLYDIGSGNGFPGLVYSILYPEQKIALIDSDSRKTEFLEQVAHLLELKNVTVINKPVEKFADGSITQAICRGFLPLSAAMMNLRKVFPKGSNLFFLKTSEWSLEVSQVPSQLCSVWQPHLFAQYTVPGAETKMFIVRAEKISD